MVILYLQSELMGYHIPILEEYINRYKAKVHVVHWDNEKLTPYIPPIIEGIIYYNKSEYNRAALCRLVQKINPSIIRVSGWMDKDYLHICKKINKNIPIVVSSDTQWKNNLKQKIGSLYFKLFIRKYFSLIWVAGPYQYEYAKRLGFNNDAIIFNCLSANTELFSKNVDKRIMSEKFPHKFVYMGRFEEIKGIKTLLQAWSNIRNKRDWTLTFIGNGILKQEIESTVNVVVKDFLQPEDLATEISKYGVLILPSVKEPWALVIHEALAGGLPVMATNVCGATPVFIIPKYNGYVFPPNDPVKLQMLMEEVINTSDSELLILAENALKRSKVITPEIAAASFMSTFIKK